MTHADRLPVEAESSPCQPPFISLSNTTPLLSIEINFLTANGEYLFSLKPSPSSSKNVNTNITINPNPANPSHPNPLPTPLNLPNFQPPHTHRMQLPN
jgi:hypothetical protein